MKIKEFILGKILFRSRRFTFWYLKRLGNRLIKRLREKAETRREMIFVDSSILAYTEEKKK